MTALQHELAYYILYKLQTSFLWGFYVMAAPAAVAIVTIITALDTATVAAVSLVLGWGHL
jgi:hypothetical protein